MENEDFNWVEAYIKMQSKKDVKTSNEFKILNQNNIDTNELTKHEPDKDAGVIELNYKDEETKETDGYNYAKGAYAFVRDMPEETIKSLMLAFLNGVDVTANVSAVVLNAMINVDPAMEAAFQNKDLANFQKSFNTNVQTFSKYLAGEKKQVKEIGETTGENSKGAEFVAMIVQDTPYALPIYKKFKSMGIPSYFALPLAYGMGSGIAFDDDATLFLNSEQVQGFKKMLGALPNSSEEKIYNTTYRMLEGTSLGFLIPKVFQGLKYAKNTIPKYMTPQTTIAVGSAAAVTAAVDKANSEEKLTFDPEVVKKLTNVMEGYRIQDVIDGLANGLPDSELLGFLEGEFDPGDLDVIKKELGITKTTTDFDPEVVKKLTNVMEGERIQAVIDGLKNGLPDSELLKFLEGEFEPSDLDLIKKELGITKTTNEDQSSIQGTVNQYGYEKTAGLTNLAVQFLKKSGTKVQDLKKIPGGTGRSVFAIDSDKVIKIAKMQRGIRENMNETDDFMIDSWRPKVFEKGDDFVVVENVARADAQTRSFLKPLQEFNQDDFKNKTSELQETMEALGLEDFLNYDLAWRDFIAARNWGKTKDGRIVLLDGGALDITTLSKEVPDYVNKDWQEILSGRKKEGMGKFIIVAGASQGYRILDTKAEANILMDNVLSNEPTTDAEIDKAYGVGASENAMVEALKPKTNQDMQDVITKAENADDQILFFNENTMTESGLDEPLNEYISITDPIALKEADIVFYDDETMEQMTYNKVNENDDNWIILNKDNETSYNQ